VEWSMKNRGVRTMFEKITPEEAGVSSRHIEQYISMLERRGMTIHGILMMKGDKVFTEHYWAPFHQNFCHRAYSQTKSFVGIAIGLLIDDGKLKLNDKICQFFPEKIEQELFPELANQTIEQMLTMTTVGGCASWFEREACDRTKLYFEPRKRYRLPGTIWKYDSAGSQVLSALVEKLSGKSLFEYLNERIFSHLGTFRTAEILKTPNGDSWGDSAMICTLRDMASFGRLLMKNGAWEGKQLISEEYVKKATSNIVDNRINCHEDVFSHGYGYQIWRTEQNGFAFNGMGAQLTICLPEKDLLFTVYGDNQGHVAAKSIIVGGFMDYIASTMSQEALPEDKCAEHLLEERTRDLKMRAIQGNADSPYRKRISGKTYICEDNALGIEKFAFFFDDTDEGEFRYTNQQGNKTIRFGINKNVFGKFPQYGYSNECGGVPTTDGYLYDDAVSLCWASDNRILMCIQIIDRYFGKVSAVFGFHDKDAVCHFEKNAEDFLKEYEGDFLAHCGDI